MVHDDGPVGLDGVEVSVTRDLRVGVHVDRVDRREVDAHETRRLASVSG